MRSYEERCAEVKRRIAAEKRKKRLRRGRLVMAAAAAACLALLAGVSIAMPGMTAQLQPDSCTGQFRLRYIAKEIRNNFF